MSVLRLWGLCFLLGAALTACTAVPTRLFEIRQRAFSFQPDAVAKDYQEEFRYIDARRRSVSNGISFASADGTSAQPIGVPKNLTGLAFSGGGLRSATFHLGLLEALQHMGKLDRMDYLSTVSGGSYLAGWLVAHVGEEQDDPYGNAVQTPDLDRLVDPRDDFVTHLRHHAGFIREHGFWEGPSLIGQYLWRFPFYYLWDVVLHIKTYPNIGNQLHLYNPYRRRIEATYLRGQEGETLAEVNRVGRAAPYVIFNGNLVNRGRPRGYPTEVDRPYRDNFNFEFTRDFTGSDGLGYVETAGFGLPVVDVLNADKQSAMDDPRWVEVEDRPRGTCAGSAGPVQQREYCVKLSDAMTASGAGLDLDSLMEEWYRDDIARLLLRFASVPFNFNNEFQTWNFARRYNGTWGTLWDYILMMTVQRLWPDTKSRWIEVTDGAFFDNLGVYALLRRQVSHIVVGDATLDTTWQYDYVHNLQRKVRSYFGEGVEWCGEVPQEHEIVWYRRFWIRRPDGGLTVLHYLKPYAYNSDLFKANPSLLPPGEPYVSVWPEERVLDQLGRGAQVSPTHLDVGAMRARVPDEAERREIEASIKKVQRFVASPKANGFPQTGTILQWYDLEEFEAYRQLGYVMGWAYLGNLGLSADELRPTVPCRPL